MIKLKLQKYLENYEGGYKHLNAIRYLKKRDSELWNDIVVNTSFLDEGKILPKQRCWHILNDIYHKPTCPVTGKYVKWHENRYLGHISFEAIHKNPDTAKKRVQTYKERTGHDGHWSTRDIVKEKVRTTYYKNRAYGKHIIVPSPFSDPKVQQRMRDDCLKKYGVDNHSKRPEIIAKIRRHDRNEYDQYYLEVKEYTKENWIHHFDKINPDRLVRGPEMHLDHIFAIAEGYRQKVPACIIGHWTNLQMLSRDKNSGKRDRCWKTKESLFEDYENNIN